MSSKPADTSDAKHDQSTTERPAFDKLVVNKFIKVAIPVPLRQLFDYLPPETHLSTTIHPGSRVVVPFGPQKMVGIVLSIESSTDIPANKLKPIISVLDEEALVPEDIIQLCQWAARYYHHSIGKTLLRLCPKPSPGQTDTLKHHPFWYPLVKVDSKLRSHLKRSKNSWPP